jgi:hypothetical protein
MKIRLLAVTSLAVSVVAGPLQAQSAAPYEIVRMNDSAMTCEALIGEINGLSDEVRRQTADAERAARNRQTAGAVGRGLLGGLARGASMFGYGGGSDGIGGAVAASAIASIASEAASSASSPAAPAAPPSASPQSQRLTYLTDLHRTRAC